jgi:hypothetical protein
MITSRVQFQAAHKKMLLLLFWYIYVLNRHNGPEVCFVYKINGSVVQTSPNKCERVVLLGIGRIDVIK